MKKNNDSFFYSSLSNILSLSVVIILIIFFGMSAPLIQKNSGHTEILILIALTPWFITALKPVIFPDFSKNILLSNHSIVSFKNLILKIIPSLLLSVYGIIIYRFIPQFQYSVFFFFSLFILAFLWISGYLLKFIVRGFKDRWSSNDFRKDMG